MTRPAMWPPIVMGPFSTATSPKTSRPRSISIGPVSRRPVLALNRAAASRDTSGGKPRLPNVVSDR